MLRKKLNLQFFAEENPEGKVNPDGDNPKDTGGNPENNAGGDPQPGDEKPDGKFYTQAEIDAMIQARLERAEKKRKEEAERIRLEEERKRLEENNDFKELADKYKAELEQLRQDALEAKKTSLLAKAGYNDEQVDRYKKYLTGDTDEALQAALEELKKDVPPTPRYVDPNMGNGSKPKPQPKDKEEKGRSLYQRLKEQGRIR